jgi:hypothetical protein
VKPSGTRLADGLLRTEVSASLRRPNVGVTQVGERIWLVTFMHYDLGYFDDETCFIPDTSMAGIARRSRDSTMK